MFPPNPLRGLPNTICICRKMKILAPGPKMTVFYTDVEVRSCEEAVAARGVPLQNELKTILYESAVGPFVVHVPGDMKIDQRRVKMACGCKDIRPASAEMLDKFGIERGTVSPFFEPIWSMSQYMSDELTTRRPLTTNSNSLTGYHFFEPEELLVAPFILVGQYAKTA